MLDTQHTKQDVTEHLSPKRGDIIWISLDPVKGHEQGGWRPFLVLTPYEHQDLLGRVSGVPLTSKIRQVMTEVAIAGLPLPSVAQIDQVTTVDISRRRWKWKGEAAHPHDIDRTVRTLNKFLGG